MIKIDGSYGEGGGQVVRTACALAAVTGNDLHIYNIRKNRKRTGLRTQHLEGIRCLKELCSGELEGDTLGSGEIVFRTGVITSNRIKAKINTAGSLSLILQTLLFPSFFSPENINIQMKGGATDTYLAPTIDYTRHLLLDILGRINLRANIRVSKKGFYPAGGAILDVEVFPGFPETFYCPDRGKLLSVLVTSGASGHLRGARVAERQAESAEKTLHQIMGRVEIIKDVEYFSTISPGSQITIVGKYENSSIGSCELGRPGKRAEVVGEEAANNYLIEHQSGASLDRHACDQILPYLAMAKGRSLFTTPEITLHASTNIWVIQKFLDRNFTISDKGKKFIVEIE